MLETQDASTSYGQEARPASNQEERRQSVYRQARRMYDQEPDWVTFHREVFGLSGLIRQNYPDAHALADFQETDEYNSIQQMIAKLRERNGSQAGEEEPPRMITVRLPKSVHEFLRVESHERHTSMNKLCISKLLQMIDGGLVPSGD